MPNYYNPYTSIPYNNLYPATYNAASYSPLQQVPNMVDMDLTMKWVDGEIGAKAFQMPTGWPVNKPIALWDSTDTVIWLKSWNQMGMPNPMQKLKYEMQEQQTPALPGNSASTKPEETLPDMSKYVTKEDLSELKNELRNMLRNNQNGSNQAQNANRGGNK